MRMVRDSSPTAPRLPLVERSRRVGERVEDDVCAARLEERREQHLQKKKSEPTRRGARLGWRGEAGHGPHIDELVRHHVRVEVRLLEDLLHRRRLGERVEERLAWGGGAEEGRVRDESAALVAKPRGRRERSSPARRCVLHDCVGKALGRLGKALGGVVLSRAACAAPPR